MLYWGLWWLFFILQNNAIQRAKVWPSTLMRSTNQTSWWILFGSQQLLIMSCLFLVSSVSLNNFILQDLVTIFNMYTFSFKLPLMKLPSVLHESKEHTDNIIILIANSTVTIDTSVSHTELYVKVIIFFIKLQRFRSKLGFLGNNTQ